MAHSNRDMLTNVSGSVGVICTSRLFSTRVTASAAPSPSVIPMASCLSPTAKTRRSTFPRVAPKAMRTPISWVRWLTE